MPILRPRGRRTADEEGPVKFIDLAEYKFFEEDEPDKSSLRVAEISKYEDIKKIADYLYNGDIIILDCSYAQRDDLTMRRIIEEIKGMGKDVGGDYAALSKSLYALTPKGIRIDRKKIKTSF